MSDQKEICNNGFSIIEVLISLSLFLIIILSSLEFFMTVKDHFFNLKKDQELNIAAFAALDKMRIDFKDSGRGLLIPQKLGIVSCVESDDKRISIRSKDKDLFLKGDLIAGSTRITLYSTSGVKKGQELTIHDGQKGEKTAVLSVDKEALVLASPINFTYSQMASEVLVMKKISFYPDEERQILRRQVNSSPAQPLLEGVEALTFSYDDTSNLINVYLKTSEEKTYAISVFPKNMYLVSAERTK
jgi:prepilin-type N-terminal cleavage/methylation domain-containing protein